MCLISLNQSEENRKAVNTVGFLASSFFAPFGYKYIKDRECLQIVLCKYFRGLADERAREREGGRGVKQRDKGWIRVKCRYTSDITCSYFTALGLNNN